MTVHYVVPYLSCMCYSPVIYPSPDMLHVAVRVLPMLRYDTYQCALAAILENKMAVDLVICSLYSLT